MNEPMDLSATMRGYILGVLLRTAGMMMLELMFTIIPQESERMREVLKRELTQEDWEDLSQSLGERLLDQRCLQRAIDREKIRRLVFGEDSGGNSKVS